MDAYGDYLYNQDRPIFDEWLWMALQGRDCEGFDWKAWVVDARAIVEGRWIKAGVPEPCFGLGSLIAAAQGDAWSKMASVLALMGAPADEPVVIEVSGDGAPPTSTRRSELLQGVISTSHWPLLELCFRLGMDCVSAEEEAEEAWGIVDQTTGDAIARDEALERAAALEKHLADARAKIERLVREERQGAACRASGGDGATRTVVNGSAAVAIAGPARSTGRAHGLVLLKLVNVTSHVLLVCLLCSY